jgi:Ca2+-binding EF-hand superfamily protein
MFDVFDDDKSGHLDRAEVSKIIEQMKAVAVVLKRDPEHVDQFMKALLTKIDKDGDGNISKEEWVQGGLRTPSLLVLLGANSF